METRGLLAEWDCERQRLKVSGLMKVPFAVRSVLATLLDVPEEAIDGIEATSAAALACAENFTRRIF